MVTKIFSAIRAHKIRATIVILLIAGIAWWQFGRPDAAANGEVRYVLAAAGRSTLVSSVSGTGQVSSTQQIDVKPKASGTVTSVTVQKGQKVRAGTVIATIDSRDAQRAVREAETALETAQLSLDRLHEPPDALDVLQAEHSLAQSKEAAADAQGALTQSFSDGYTDLSNAFLDLPGVMTDLDDVLYGHDLSTNQDNIDAYGDRLKEFDVLSPYAASARQDYDTARDKYEAAFAAFKTLSRSSESAAIEALIRDTTDTVLSVSGAVKSTTNLVQSYRDTLTAKGKTPSVASASHLSSLSGMTSTMNGVVSSLSSSVRAIDNARASITTTARTVAEREGSLAKLKKGTDTFDLRSQELAVEQKRQALADARAALADYVVTAPFDGVIAECDLKRGDSANASTVAATLLAEQRLAEVPLNEVDVARVKVGQQVTLAFDAVSDLTISGKVADIDSVGASSQGVVTYGVRVTFDTQDERVKPSMTVSAAIITEAKTDVLSVPASAVKGTGDGRYVEVVANPPQNSDRRGVALTVAPERRQVEVGLSTDDAVEIVSGLEEGETVVVSTIQPSAATTPSTTSGTGAQRAGSGNQLFSVPTGGTVRLQGR